MGAKEGESDFPADQIPADFSLAELHRVKTLLTIIGSMECRKNNFDKKINEKVEITLKYISIKCRRKIDWINL